MNRILFLIISLLSSITHSQSFEGRLTYEIEYKFKMKEISEKDMINHMKKSGEYFDTLTINIKNGDYEKVINSVNSKRIVYKSDINKIYTFDKGFEYVLISNANRYSSTTLELERPKIVQNDSLEMIMNKECKSITLDWNGLGKEVYYYNEDFLKINSNLFQSHNYEYLNEILSLTNSYPIKITKSLNNMIEIRMTLVDYSDEEISESAFEIPKLKSAEKEYSDIIMETTGSEVMQIKN